MIRAGIAIPLIIGVSRYSGAKVAKFSNIVQTNLANSSKIANETLGAGFKTVHSFNKQNYEFLGINKQLLRYSTTLCNKLNGEARCLDLIQ